VVSRVFRPAPLKHTPNQSSTYAFLERLRKKRGALVSVVCDHHVGAMILTPDCTAVVTRILELIHEALRNDVVLSKR
jgi:hypothetical protein